MTQTMVPKVGKGGTSFKGVFNYLTHDKGADTSERVGWFRAVNMNTSDPDEACKIMAYTARSQERLKEASGQSRAGRKLEKPAFPFSLAWHPEQSPDAEHMYQTALAAIAYLGLSEHEAGVVYHKDEPQKHVHIVINRVHPITGLAGDVRNSKRKLSDFAREYERTHGKIYCQRREDNYKERKAGKSTRYVDPTIDEAWQNTDNGRDFVAALAAKKYRLAHGRKRLVVIDPHGKTLNPVRNIKGIKAVQFLHRMRDLDFDRIPDAKLAFTKAQTEDPARTKRWKLIAQLDKMRAEMEERHRQELREAKAQHMGQIHSAKETLAEYYKLPQRKKQLQRLKKQINQAPLWKRVFGITRKDRKALAEQVITYKYYVTCYRQKIMQVQQNGQDRLISLQREHHRNEGALKLEIDMRRAFEDRPEPAPERTKDTASRAPERTHNRGRVLEI